MSGVQGNIAPPATASGALFALVMLAGAGPVRAQVLPDSSGRLPSQLLSAVAALPPAAHLRVTTQLGTFTGRVTSRSDDALTVTLQNSAQVRTIALSDIDTLWVPARKSHSGLLAGAGLGALLAGLLAASPKGGDDPGLNTLLAGVALVGGVLVGLTIDSVERWTHAYP